ncbi:hypothetical protein JWG44_21955 [Leptospira sp. 201903071]|uniref:hypothetical protein n=1 Tax=Leptospira ainazelensis TaxID=2810034 RepID=UPI00196419E7|nr:hypothetical protein [Leptospira ainazelensis]MBM9502921.1 hypothetical protein [Leptospira ainazelensis]
MNKDTRAGYIACEAMLAFETFRKTRGYRPNEEEKVTILNDRGYVNALRVIRYLEYLKTKLLEEIGQKSKVQKFQEYTDRVILPALEGGISWPL